MFPIPSLSAFRYLPIPGAANRAGVGTVPRHFSKHRLLLSTVWLHFNFCFLNALASRCAALLASAFVGILIHKGRFPLGTSSSSSRGSGCWVGYALSSSSFCGTSFGTRPGNGKPSANHCFRVMSLGTAKTASPLLFLNTIIFIFGLAFFILFTGYWVGSYATHAFTFLAKPEEIVLNPALAFGWADFEVYLINRLATGMKEWLSGHHFLL